MHHTHAYIILNANRLYLDLNSAAMGELTSTRRKGTVFAHTRSDAYPSDLCGAGRGPAGARNLSFGDRSALFGFTSASIDAA